MTRQRYYQILQLFQYGAQALCKCQNAVRKAITAESAEVVRQVIRHRFLDPQISPEVVIAQKLVQSGFAISTRVSSG